MINNNSYYHYHINLIFDPLSILFYSIPIDTKLLFWTKSIPIWWKKYNRRMTLPRPQMGSYRLPTVWPAQEGLLLNQPVAKMKKPKSLLRYLVHFASSILNPPIMFDGIWLLVIGYYYNNSASDYYYYWSTCSHYRLYSLYIFVLGSRRASHVGEIYRPKGTRWINETRTIISYLIVS